MFGLLVSIDENRLWATGKTTPRLASRLTCARKFQFSPKRITSPLRSFMYRLRRADLGVQRFAYCFFGSIQRCAFHPKHRARYHLRIEKASFSQLYEFKELKCDATCASLAKHRVHHHTGLRNTALSCEMGRIINARKRAVHFPPGFPEALGFKFSYASYYFHVAVA